MSAPLQSKLLQVLQDGEFARLGGRQDVRVDVRVVAATNRNLKAAVAARQYREDLYFRLSVFPITIPPLRDRPDDIPALVWSFVDEFSSLFGKKIESISKDSMRDLQRYPWPGNVRELRNVIERAVIVSNGRVLSVPAPKVGERSVPQTAMTLTALEVEHIRAVLEATNWRIRGNGGAAERLGLKPTTLESRMARLGITRKKTSGGASVDRRAARARRIGQRKRGVHAGAGAVPRFDLQLPVQQADPLVHADQAEPAVAHRRRDVEARSAVHHIELNPRGRAVQRRMDDLALPVLQRVVDRLLQHPEHT
jgi:hypothetical protein